MEGLRGKEAGCVGYPSLHSQKGDGGGVRVDGDSDDGGTIKVKGDGDSAFSVKMVTVVMVIVGTR